MEAKNQNLQRLNSNVKRAVLIPQKTNLRFDLGGLDNARDSSSSLDVGITGRKGSNLKLPHVPSSSSSSAATSVATSSSSSTRNHYGQDPKVVNNEAIDRFLEAAAPAVASGLTREDSNIMRSRVIEEMYRIQERTHITPAERQKLIQLAMTMDAPRLARKLVSEAKEDRYEDSEGNEGAFLTGKPMVQLSLGFDDSETLRSSRHTPRQTQAELQERDEDAIFCKAFDEVERIRQRILQRATAASIRVPHEEMMPVPSPRVASSSSSRRPSVEVSSSSLHEFTLSDLLQNQTSLPSSTRERPKDLRPMGYDPRTSDLKTSDAQRALDAKALDFKATDTKALDPRRLAADHVMHTLDMLMETVGVSPRLSDHVSAAGGQVQQPLPPLRDALRELEQVQRHHSMRFHSAKDDKEVDRRRERVKPGGEDDAHADDNADVDADADADADVFQEHAPGPGLALLHQSSASSQSHLFRALPDPALAHSQTLSQSVAAHTRLGHDHTRTQGQGHGHGQGQGLSHSLSSQSYASQSLSRTHYSFSQDTSGGGNGVPSSSLAQSLSQASSAPLLPDRPLQAAAPAAGVGQGRLGMELRHAKALLLSPLTDWIKFSKNLPDGPPSLSQPHPQVHGGGHGGGHGHPSPSPPLSQQALLISPRQLSVHPPALLKSRFSFEGVALAPATALALSDPSSCPSPSPFPSVAQAGATNEDALMMSHVKRSLQALGEQMATPVSTTRDPRTPGHGASQSQYGQGASSALVSQSLSAVPGSTRANPIGAGGSSYGIGLPARPLTAASSSGPSSSSSTPVSVSAVRTTAELVLSRNNSSTSADLLATPDCRSKKMALAAALNAGDAVGKLMAEMMSQQQQLYRK